MNIAFTVLLFALMGVLILLGLTLMVHFHKKSQIESSVQVQCSSGDSEVMSFSYNFERGESEASKQMKLFEAFNKIERRRKANHDKWLEIQKQAIEEKEKHAVEEKAKHEAEKAKKLHEEAKEGA